MNLATLVDTPQFIRDDFDFGPMRNIRVGITGGGGLLGGLLSQRLDALELPYSSYEGDVTDTDIFQRWLLAIKPTVLIHLAAIVPVCEVESDPTQAMRVNAASLLNIAEAVRGFAEHECWVFFASSSHVYAPHPGGSKFKINENDRTTPISLYGDTKLAAEYMIGPLARAYGFRCCIGRIFSFFHERQNESFLITGLIKRLALAQKGVVEVYDSNSVRDFLYAESVVDIILRLARMKFSGTINIGSGSAMSVREIAERVLEFSGSDASLVFKPSDKPTSLVADVEKLTYVINHQAV